MGASTMEWTALVQAHAPTGRSDSASWAKWNATRPVLAAMNILYDCSATLTVTPRDPTLTPHGTPPSRAMVRPHLPNRYYSLFGSGMEAHEWEKIVARHLLTDAEVELLGAYKGFVPTRRGSNPLNRHAPWRGPTRHDAHSLYRRGSNHLHHALPS
jgi:hypothetical protein